MPGAQDAGPAVVNATFNVGIAGGGLIGSRELLIASPPVLAFTGAGLAAAAVLVLFTQRRKQHRVGGRSR